MTPIRTNKLIIDSLAWYLNPVYDVEKKDFSGTVLYKHNAAISPAFAGRVRFLGDLEKDCSLQLSDLRASENGLYGLRLIVSNPRQKQEEKKWMTRISVNVTASPPAPQIQAPSELRESIPAQAVCSVAYYCPDYPITLTWVGLGHGTPEPTTRMDSGRTQSSLTFTPTWQDHGKNVTCRLSTPAGTPSSESSVVLDVKCAPKGVRVELVTGSPIQERTTVVLKLLTAGLIRRQQLHMVQKRAASQNKPSRSLARQDPSQPVRFHHCEPQNRVGMSESPAITIDVQCP
ncbi:B-cell receptor CD22-like, partial [Mauremys reevesii]|uniref:B-cell receptor CD22-like n=1 Tax=Mauremys reevesii TaxID=260615 RepID=UPI00193F38D7